MKTAIAILLAIALVFSFGSCGGSAPNQTDPASDASDATAPSQTDPEPSDIPKPSDTEEDEGMKIEITIGSETFPATLYDSAAAKALLKMLPLTLPMSELNGNEKYYYLDTTLPTDSKVPAGIQAGDLMLYGNNCLVLFYESFSTSYSYTPLGRVDDPEGLAAVLGTGSVQVTFQKGE